MEIVLIFCLMLMSLASFLHALVVNQDQQLAYTHTFPFTPNWYYLMIPKYVLHSIYSLYELQSKDW